MARSDQKNLEWRVRELERQIRKLTGRRVELNGDLDLNGNRIIGLAPSGGASDGAVRQDELTGGNAPSTAQYLTLSADSGLSNERIFTPGTSLSATDNGANNAYDLDTVQDIRTTASPEFNGLKIDGFEGVIYGTAGVLSDSAGVNDLSDVSISGIADNDLLQYSSGSAIWTNVPVASLGITADDAFAFFMG